MGELIVWALNNATPIEVVLFVIGAGCVTIALFLMMGVLFRD